MMDYVEITELYFAQKSPDFFHKNHMCNKVMINHAYQQLIMRVCFLFGLFLLIFVPPVFY